MSTEFNPSDLRSPLPKGDEAEQLNLNMEYLNNHFENLEKVEKGMSELTVRMLVGLSEESI